MEKRHTMKVFDEELTKLKKSVKHMVEMVGGQLNDAIAAFSAVDYVLAEKVIENDQKINRQQKSVDDCTLRLLALRQPMARDLRHILTAAKMASNLERIADYACTVAKRTLELGEEDLASPMESIAGMGRIGMEMLSQIGNAYIAVDAEEAIAVWKKDSEVDKAYSEVMQTLSEYMAQHSECVEPCIALLSAARAMERIGDLITNLAEEVYFLATSKQYPPVETA
jgi:phosphate transport system protein